MSINSPECVVHGEQADIDGKRRVGPWRVVARPAKRLHLSPSAMSRALARLRETTGDSLLVGVVRSGHPLARGKITAARYAAGRHILVSRTGAERDAIDDALQSLGLERQVATIVGGFSTAVGLSRVSDLIACVPERHTASLRQGLHSFALPVPSEAFTVSLLWHPRFAADPAHLWLRSLVREVCAEGADPHESA